jgi:hypothetical protein
MAKRKPSPDSTNIRVDRQSMHRRAQVAEGELVKQRAKTRSVRDQMTGLYNWFKERESTVKDQVAGEILDEMASEYFIVRKPKWLRGGR